MTLRGISSIYVTRGVPLCEGAGAIVCELTSKEISYEAGNVRGVIKEEAFAIFNRVLASTTADRAAKIIIAGIKKDKLRIMVGTDAYVLDWLKRLFPVGFQKLAGRKVVPAWMKKKAGLQS